MYTKNEAKSDATLALWIGAGMTVGCNIMVFILLVLINIAHTVLAFAGIVTAKLMWRTAVFAYKMVRNRK